MSVWLDGGGAFIAFIFKHVLKFYWCFILVEHFQLHFMPKIAHE